MKTSTPGPRIATRLSLSAKEWQAVRTAARLLESQEAPFADLILPGTGTLARLEKTGGRFTLRPVSEGEFVQALREATGR